MKEKKSKMIWAVIILSILLFSALAYIIYLNYSAYNQKKEIAIYQSGAKYGYEQAILEIMQQSATCKQVPLYYGNITFDIIAIPCLTQNPGLSTTTDTINQNTSSRTR